MSTQSAAASDAAGGARRTELEVFLRRKKRFSKRPSEVGNQLPHAGLEPRRLRNGNPVNEAPHVRHEIDHLNWLPEKLVTAAIKGCKFMMGEDAHRDNGYFLDPRLILDQGNELESIHVGQVELEQNQVGVVLNRLAQPAFTGYRDNRGQPGKHDLFDQQLGVIWLFLNNQDCFLLVLAKLHKLTTCPFGATTMPQKTNSAPSPARLMCQPKSRNIPRFNRNLGRTNLDK